MNGLSDDINRNIVQSEVDGGVFLSRLKPGTRLLVWTQSRVYTIVVIDGAEGRVTISGHPIYCPWPTKARISGCTWGGSMLKMNFIGRGMNLEFCTEVHPAPIATTTIKDITELKGDNDGNVQAV